MGGWGPAPIPIFPFGSLLPPCSLPCPNLSPGTLEAAAETLNAPPTVRRRGKSRSLSEVPRPPMMQATLLDTIVQGPVGCGQPSEGGSLRWVVAGWRRGQQGGRTEIDNTRKNQAQTLQGQCYSPQWLHMKVKGCIYELDLHCQSGVTGRSMAGYD